MGRAVVWVHDESIALHNTENEHLPDVAHAFFVWDNQYFSAMRYGLRRLVFIFEAVNDLGIPIYQGRHAEVCQYVAQQFNANIVCSVLPSNPSLRNSVAEIQDEVKFEWSTPDAMPTLADSNEEFLRFHRYWSAVRDSVLKK
tara:strand:- start:39 stop:464 length:426 start_codon:yes stop_codon:yes gene_type:complete